MLNLCVFLVVFSNFRHKSLHEYQQLFVQSITHTTKPFELVHFDLWGPSLVIFVNVVKYFLLFIDDCTHFSWMYLLNSNHETIKYLQFKLMVEIQFSTKILTIQSN